MKSSNQISLTYKFDILFIDMGDYLCLWKGDDNNVNILSYIFYFIFPIGLECCDFSQQVILELPHT